MLSSKKSILRPLLESAEGIHLTAYLVNNGDLEDLKSQIQDTLDQSNEWLSPVMSTEARVKFLEPIESILTDSRIFEQMKHNFGIFRNETSFRLLNIPIQVEQSCHVATSFHVKPLLKWIQTDQEFLLLGLKHDSAHLYLGTQSSLKHFHSILFRDLFHEDNYENRDLELRLKKRKDNEIFALLNEWILGLTKKLKPRLFLAGEPALIELANRNLNYVNTVKTPIVKSFDPQKVNEVCHSIRKILRDESKALIEKALLDFRFAEEGNRARKNLFQIAKAVVKGQVRKLIVTDEISIFGKIDQRSGGLLIHPFDLDHEDDDILDDLAQMVLSQGGEVIIASRDEIPKGRPILAILDDDGLELEKTEIFQERVV